MPASAVPRIVSGPKGSPVLVDGRPRPAAAGAAVGATVVAATAAVAAGVAVGAGLGEAAAPGVAVGATVGVIEGATVNGGRVGGMSSGAAAHADVKNLSLISVTLPFRASALPVDGDAVRDRDGSQSHDRSNEGRARSQNG
jgi:hypothetical protein